MYGEAGIQKEECVKPATTVIAYTYFCDKPEFCENDVPAYFIVGKKDAIVPWEEVKERVDNMKKAGCIVEEHIINNRRDRTRHRRRDRRERPDFRPQIRRPRRERRSRRRRAPGPEPDLHLAAAQARGRPGAL